MRRRIAGRGIGALVLVATLLVGCTSGQGTSAPGARPSDAQQTLTRQKTIVLAISNTVESMGVAGSNTTSGGWQSVNELHSQGLVTSDYDSARPIARLATQIPSFDNGAMEILPDGRMKTVYPLRRDVLWQDGTPFTSQDLMFAYEMALDRNMPRLSLEASSQMDSAEAPDDYTFVLYWKGPYYQADSVGLRAFWPQPRHLLEQSYRTLDPQGFINLPYWTTDYIHLGPFQVAEFKPGEELVFTAFDRYFLGRPKLDRVIVKIYNDENTLYSATLAGAVDILMDNSLNPDFGLQLKETWDASGQGKVYLGTGTTRFVAPQFDPAIQVLPAVLDPRVRQALMYAMDRPAISEVVQRGHGEFVANSLLPPSDRLYEPVKDGYARYSYDAARARSTLAQLGWSLGGDGVLVGPDGRRFVVPLWTTQGSEREIAIIADYWKQVGVQADQFVVPGARVRDREYRSSYPGFETSAAGAGDAILNRLESRQTAIAPNFSGTNRGHYINPQFDGLIDRYRQSLTERDQSQAIRSVSDAAAEDLPVLLLYFNPTNPAVRKGVKALEDFRGGSEGARLYGTFTRNAHEWDLQ